MTRVVVEPTHDITWLSTQASNTLQNVFIYRQLLLAGPDIKEGTIECFSNALSYLSPEKQPPELPPAFWRARAKA